MLYLRLGAVTVTQYVRCADIAAGRVDFDVTNTCLAANRDSGTASPAGHSPAEQTKADAASGMGSALVGSPRSPLAGMAPGPHPGQARDRYQLRSTSGKREPLRNITWLQLGRTFILSGTRLRVASHDGGVDLRTVQEILRHKSILMTQRYSHLSPAHQKSAVDALENGLSSRIGMLGSVSARSGTTW